MDFFVLCVLLCFSAATAVNVAFDVTPTEAYLTPGETVTLRCTATEAGGFFLMYFWKYQGADPGEATAVAANWKLEDAFAKTGRFHAEKEANDMLVVLVTITDIEFEDSGHYGCSATDSDSPDPREAVFKPVIVTRAVSSLLLEGWRVSDPSDVRRMIHGEKWHLEEEGEFVFRCSAGGSSPAASMRITMAGEERELTTETEEVVSGEVPFLQKSFDVKSILARPILIDRSVNKKKLTCEAVVAMFEPSAVNVQPVFKHEPTIVCNSTMVQIWHQDVVLRCLVSSEPPVEHVSWQWNNNGKMELLRSGDELGRMAARIVADDNDPDNVVFELHFERVLEQHFRTYTVVGDYGSLTVQAEVTLIRDPTPVVIASASFRCASLLLVLVALLL